VSGRRPSSKRTFLVLSRCAILLAIGVPFRAAAESRDPVAAEALFDEARQLMESGKYDEACAKLEASQKLDPGVGTLLNLGDCLERTGRTASAWERFREAAAAAVESGQREREEIARLRAASIEPKLCRLIVRVPPEADLPGLALERDLVPFERALWNEPLPIDPGSHQVRATAPGRRPWSGVTDVESPTCQGATEALGVPVLENAPVAPLFVEPPRTTRWGLQRELALVGGGLGLLLIGTGAGLAIDAAVSYTDAKNQCEAKGCPPGAQQSAADAGRTADFATAAFVTSGALLVASGVLWFTARQRPVTIGPAVYPGGAGMSIRGSLF
jgi:hypothetical protein